MVTYKKFRNDKAISPVVGIMLMLVVTVVIAAVVTAYAGGLTGSTKQAPKAIIEGTYSQTDGMKIIHVSGDPVALSEVQFRTTPSELFGADAAKFAWPIDKTIILFNKDGVNQPVTFPGSGFYNKSSFIVGDTLTIAKSNCTDYVSSTDINATPWAKTLGEQTKSGKTYWGIITSFPGVNANARVNWGLDSESKAQYFAAYAFSNPANIGKYFYLDLVDPSGNRIHRAKVTITA
nr:type IV pilin N-terminal domain-containing protein [uncultured Methanoregula sp.]